MGVRVPPSAFSFDPGGCAPADPRRRRSRGPHNPRSAPSAHSLTLVRSRSGQVRVIVESGEDDLFPARSGSTILESVGSGPSKTNVPSNHVMRYVALAYCASVISLNAQVPSRTMTPAEQIAATEARGAAFPRASGTETFARKCTVVRPEQIVFPTTTGYPSAFNLVSGDFWAGSISFGWDRTHQQAKMPLTPRHFSWGDRPDELC